MSKWYLNVVTIIQYNVLNMKIIFFILFIILVGCQTIRKTVVILYNDLNLGNNLNKEKNLQEKDLQEKLSSQHIRINKDKTRLSRSKFPLWTPLGERNGAFPLECSDIKMNQLIDRIINGKSSDSEVGSFEEHCLLPFAQSKISSLQTLKTMSYDIVDHSWVRPVRLLLDDGPVVNGFLALKPDLAKRPLIVIQCGFGCGTKELHAGIFPLIIHLYDEGPFHVLLINSSTTSDFMIDNKKVSLGGVYEGKTLIKVAQLLKSSESKLKPLISSIHLAGMSWGGHAALFASLYNGYIGKTKDQRYFQSVVALCPAIDLEKTATHLFSDPYTRFYSQTAWEQISKSAKSIPAFGQLIDSVDRPSDLELLSVLVKMGINHNRLYSNLIRQFPPPVGGKIADEKNFWAYNNFLRYYKEARSKTLILSAEDDTVVPFKHNGRLLMEKMNERHNPSLQIVTLKHNSHCEPTLSYNQYGWMFVGRLLRSFFLDNSPDFTRKTGVRELKLSELELSSSWKLNQAEYYWTYKWLAHKNQNYLSLQMKVLSLHKDNKDLCWKIDPFVAERSSTWRGCFRDLSTKVLLSKLNKPVPSNQIEKDVLARWANANLKLYDIAGSLVGISNNMISSIGWSQLLHPISAYRLP